MSGTLPAPIAKGSGAWRLCRSSAVNAGAFGWVVLVAFWAFNLFMLTTCVAGMNATSELSGTAMSEAERAGAGIGTVLGLGIILSLWFMGAAILGLMVAFTRGPKVIETVER